MGFAHPVNIVATIKAFKAKYNIPQYVLIEYCLEGNIDDERESRVIFIPLMAVLVGRVRFPLDPLLLCSVCFIRKSCIKIVFHIF